MPNEIIVKVKVIEDDGNRAIRARLEAQARDLGDTIAVNVNQKVTERLERDARAATSTTGGYSRVGDQIGETIGRRVSEKISERIKVDVNERVSENLRGSERVSVNERLRDSRGRFISGNGNNRETVHVDVDVDKQSLLQKLSSFGGSVQEKVSSWFSGGLSTGITSVFSGDVFSSLIKGALMTLGAGVLAPEIGAAIGAAVLAALSGGAIGIGIIGALKDPRIKKATDAVKEALGFNTGTPKEQKNEPMHGLFKSFSDNFKGPLEEFLAPSNGGGGGVVGLIQQLTPMIDDLGKKLGPIAGNLGNGIIGFLQNLLPTIIRGMEAGAPLINTLANRLPGIGDALGDVFNTISAHADDANTFFNDLLRGVELVIRTIGVLIGWLLDLYTIMRKVFVAMIDTVLNFAGIAIRAFASAFDWVPGLGPKLRKAEANFDQFRKSVVSSLNKVPSDKYIDIHLRTIFNGVFQTIGSMTRQLQAIGAVRTGNAHGGAVATAATGGSRNGLTLVGEHGPELIDAAPGSNVYSNADSMRMIGQMGGAGRLAPIVVNLVVDGMTLARATVDPMRRIVNDNFGGSVQAAYGR